MRCLLEKGFDFVSKELGRRNKALFEKLYFEYSEGLVRFAEGFLFDRQASEDVVQNLFVYIWDHAEDIEISTSIKSYLYQSTRNRCLNVIRNLRVRDKHQLLFMEATINSQNVDGTFDEELFEKLEEAMNQLPERMLEIFRLKYIEGKKIKDIADVLQISENTIKTQLSRARERIGDYILFGVILFLYNQ